MQRCLVAPFRHLFPGAADDVEEFLFVVLLGEGFEVVFQKYEADYFFQELAVWVGF